MEKPKESQMKVKELLIYVLFAFVFLTWLFPREKIDLSYEIKLHDLIKERKTLQNKLNFYQNEIKKNDTIINHYDSFQLDSFFTNYFNGKSIEINS
jgi:hypothetical protein